MADEATSAEARDVGGGCGVTTRPRDPRRDVLDAGTEGEVGEEARTRREEAIDVDGWAEGTTPKAIHEERRRRGVSDGAGAWYASRRTRRHLLRKRRRGASPDARPSGVPLAVRINARLTQDASSPEEVLALVRAHLPEMTHVNVSTALNRLGRMSGADADAEVGRAEATSSGREGSPVSASSSSLSSVAGAHDQNAAFHDLLRKATELALEDQYPARCVGATLIALARLDEANALTEDDEDVVNAAVAALSVAAGREAPRMDEHALASVLLGWARLGSQPDDATWTALRPALGRYAGRMSEKAAVRTLWSLARLGRSPGNDDDADATWAALEDGVRRAAPTMSTWHVVETLRAMKRLGRKPRGQTWAAMDAAIGRVAHVASPSLLAAVIGSLPCVGSSPSGATWRALDAAVARSAPDLTPRETARVVWAYGAVGRRPECPEATSALFAATARAANETRCTPRDVVRAMTGLARFTSALSDDAEAAATRAALESALCRRLSEATNARDVVNAVNALTRLRRTSSTPGSVTPGGSEGMVAALEEAVSRMAPSMLPEDASGIAGAFQTLGHELGAETAARLRNARGDEASA